jgi:Uma2 family endonuclease
VRPKDPEHAFIATLLGQMLRDVYRGWALVREDKPLDAAADTVPEPDLAVVRGTVWAYARQHPSGADAVLVVEVVRGAQEAGRQNASTYAGAGVSELWLVDLAARRIEVRTEPRPDGRFRLVRALTGVDEISPPGCDVVWKVADILPQAEEPGS